MKGTWYQTAGWTRSQCMGKGSQRSIIDLLGYLSTEERRRSRLGHVISSPYCCAQGTENFRCVGQNFEMVFFETCGPNEAMVVSGILIALQLLIFVPFKQNPRCQKRNI